MLQNFSMYLVPQCHVYVNLSDELQSRAFNCFIHARFLFTANYELKVSIKPLSINEL